MMTEELKDERDEEDERDDEDDGDDGGDGDEASRTGFLSGVVIGAAVGVALALLFAPAAGETTRRRLGHRVRRLRERAAEGIEDLREKAERRITRPRS